MPETTASAGNSVANTLSIYTGSNADGYRCKWFDSILRHYSVVAQLVEHRTVNAAVGGSIPSHGAMKEVKYIWIYPKQCLGRLGSTSIFYGTEKEYKRWANPRRGEIRKLMKNTARFIKG